MLCDLLVWFKGFTDEHKINGANRVYAELIPVVDIHEGVIQRDNKGNYFCGDFMLKYMEVHQVYEPGTRIMIKSVAPNYNSRTKDQYPQIVMSFELLP